MTTFMISEDINEREAQAAEDFLRSCETAIINTEDLVFEIIDRPFEGELVFEDMASLMAFAFTYTTN